MDSDIIIKVTPEVYRRLIELARREGYETDPAALSDLIGKVLTLHAEARKLSGYGIIST